MSAIARRLAPASPAPGPIERPAGRAPCRPPGRTSRARGGWEADAARGRSI